MHEDCIKEFRCRGGSDLLAGFCSDVLVAEFLLDSNCLTCNIKICKLFKLRSNVRNLMSNTLKILV